jgi:hypothetical protein
MRRHFSPTTHAVRPHVSQPLDVSGLNIQLDPEAIFQEGWLLCDVGEYEEGLDYLGRSVAKGSASSIE